MELEFPGNIVAKKPTKFCKIPYSNVRGVGLSKIQDQQTSQKHYTFRNFVALGLDMHAQNRINFDNVYILTHVCRPI